MPSSRSSMIEPDVPTAALLLEMSSIAKSYGTTKALTDGSLAIRPGEIRAVLGENGSGKSTLVKVLSGVVRPDTGSLSMHGSAIKLRSPKNAKHAGIETVFQETFTVPEMTVLDNIFIGSDGLFRIGHRRAVQERMANQLFEALECPIDLNRRMATLALSERQLVTVARSLVRPWKLLILDESTSALDVKVRDLLFSYLRQATANGSSIIFISHRMDEIASFADGVTLLQAGRTMDTIAISDATSERLVSKISATRDAGADVAGEVRLPIERDRSHRRYRVNDVVLQNGRQPISMDFEPGRIYGFGGLDGHGQAEFLSIVAGITKPVSGAIECEQNTSWHEVTTGRDAFNHGICYVPRDRKNDGLFLGLSIVDNFGIATLREYSTFGFVNPRRLRVAATAGLRSFSTRYDNLRSPVGRLSGGNQQKVLLARWLAAHPDLLILDDPLRGVDAATKNDIHAIFKGLADSGVSILLLSTEIEEFVSLCDQVTVFREKEISRTLDRSILDKDTVVAAMFGKLAAPRKEHAR